MNFSRSYRGLWINFDIEPYDPGVHTFSNGDPGYPPSGGGCEDWELDGIENGAEFAMEMADSWEPPARWRLGSRFLRWIILWILERYDQLRPREQDQMRKVAEALALEHWDEDIRQACEEYYWDDIGGPAGEQDYFYDG